MTCFFEEFASCATDNALTGKLFLIANQTGADFEGPCLHGAAELLCEDHSPGFGQRKNAHHAGGIGSVGELPAVDFAERDSDLLDGK